MSDFLKSLVARQLGEAPSVRPRLAGRYEPPADAFAPMTQLRTAEFEEPDANPLELFLEVEPRSTPARDAAPSPFFNEDAHAPRREPDETSTRVAFFREERSESQLASNPERVPAQTSETAPGASSSPDVDDTHARKHVREVSDAPVRPKSIVSSFGEESVRNSVESARDAQPHAEPSVDEREPVRPSFPTRSLSTVTPQEMRRDERRAPSRLGPREPSEREVEDSRPPFSNVPPSPSSTSTRIDAREGWRASDTASSFTQRESTRPRESAHSRDDAGKSNTRRHTRLFGQESAAFEPSRVRRVARQAEARDAARTQETPAPTINVTIGRVEVRATHAPQPAPRRTESKAPRMSLEDYLRRRNGEVRE